MIRITYELYYNDFIRIRQNRASFSSLEALEDWLFEQSDNPQKNFHSYFPVDEPAFIKMRITHRYYPILWVHMIENEGGIILSDGIFTGGKKHMSTQVKEWCKHCREKAENYGSTFKFVD